MTPGQLTYVPVSRGEQIIYTLGEVESRLELYSDALQDPDLPAS